MAPKVSVVLPVYNVGKYLRQCMDSIVGQTLEEIEIICVDDGSSDDSPQILQEYARKDPRVRVICQQNQGDNWEDCNPRHLLLREEIPDKTTDSTEQ